MVSDEFEPVSARSVCLPGIRRKARATRPEQQCGCPSLSQLVSQHELRRDLEAVPLRLGLGLFGHDRLTPLHCGGERERLTIAQAVLKVVSDQF